MVLATTRAHACLTLLLLVPAACGPAGIGADATTDEQGTSTGTFESSSTTTTETSASTDTSTTITFDIPGPPDMPPVTECDSFAQDCPEGEKCVPYASTGGTWDANKCVPVMGDNATGEPCNSGGVAEGTDNCDATGFCWNVQDVDGELVGVCTAFCLGSPETPECPPASSCWLSSGPVALCLPTCDPIAQDCDPGLACYWVNNAFNCILTTSDIPAGQACGFLNDCAGGTSCLDASVFPDCAGAACCSPYCDINLGDAQCDAVPGTSCVAFFEQDPPPGYEHIGVCILPP